jgi:hypothetical protein
MQGRREPTSTPSHRRFVGTPPDRELNTPGKRVGGAVELVLGVSMTPTRIHLALVEGEKADGVIVDHDVFDTDAECGSGTSRATEDVIDTILGTHEGAIDGGHHLVSTGVTWTDRADAAALREALVARGIEDVLLVSELHAAAALAQAAGRALGYDTTGLIFVERETATLAVVETADGSVVKVLSETLHSGDAIAVVADMVADQSVRDSGAQGLFVVGSAVDVTAVKEHLTDLVGVPVMAPEEPQLALARGAALASAGAPRYDASTIGLAYSQDREGTTAHSILVADLLGYDSPADVADTDADPDEVPESKKPFLLVGSSLTAIFVAGILALTIAVAVTVRPTAEQHSDVTPATPRAAALPPAGALPPGVAQVPQALPAPAPVVPPPARVAMAQLKNLPPPPPPPQVVVRNVAPAPVAAPAAPPPPVVVPPPPPPLIQLPWLPPIIQPPPYYSPSPPWYPGPSWTGRGGGGHGGHGRGGD